METLELEKLKYPIGEFVPPENITSADIEKWITDIEAFPSSLEKEVRSLSSEQLSWLYRPEGWSIRQVVHHCADSHINAYCRCKLTITEDTPEIRPYLEAKWAVLPDADNDDIGDSLLILEGLHRRWVKLLRSLKDEDLSRLYFHPEHGRKFRLAEVIGSYAWHCNHHLAHVKQAIEHEGKF
ncbi:putative metal-dependent hydrolase [Fulvivirga sp. RKSG066]|uniref:YfiT family bacillithiol transferase n=1 Tax=Fulvivirga aurantia TaxID=2529383 RepID=UPI0012BCF810|nr:putative metal-dependent hydrolase [Fulvivirga aurantia]MTI21812.1 putative metal-dependent hydrolase [Fulvivirga aurantia]